MIDIEDLDWVVFDINGVLLDLTQPEIAVYLNAFKTCGIDHVSDDWNSYKTRNDIEIIREVLTQHFRQAPSEADIATVIQAYLLALDEGLHNRSIVPKVIPGARETIAALKKHDELKLGLASANIERAARLRLAAVDMEQAFDAGGFAELGVNKSQILAALIDAYKISPNRLLFIGDHPSDVAAAHENGVEFLGIAEQPELQAKLRLAGAQEIISSVAQSKLCA